MLDPAYQGQRGLQRCEARPSLYSQVPSRLCAVPLVSLTRWPNVRRAISAPISSPMAMSAIPNTATPCRDTGTEHQVGSTQPKTQVLTAPAPTLSPGDRESRGCCWGLFCSSSVPTRALGTLPKPAPAPGTQVPAHISPPGEPPCQLSSLSSPSLSCPFCPCHPLSPWSRSAHCRCAGAVAPSGHSPSLGGEQRARISRQRARDPLLPLPP